MEQVQPQPLSLVERTAKAIYETSVRKAHKPIPWDALVQEAHERYRDMAIAALTIALYEPVEVLFA
jgi:hypothetical protein